MKQFVIIGNSAAGIAAIEAIRKIDRQSKIIVISDEGYPAYCRCLISYYLAVDIKEVKIFYRPQDFYKNNNIDLILNKKVTRVDASKSKVICDDKTRISFDSLLIATGSRPKMPDVKGIKRTGVFGFRSLKDAKDISGLLPVTKIASVLGGGLVGLKAAYALNKRGIEVKVVVKSAQVLSQVLDEQAAFFVQERLQQNGIELLLGQDVAEVIGEGETKAIKLDSGKVIGASLMIVAKGVLPNMELVKDTKIALNEGIIVNSFLETNSSNIYAAGDVCEAFDTALGKNSVNALWPVAVEQGKAAGRNMAGEKTVYGGSLSMNALEFFGLPVVSLGLFNPQKDNGIFEELKICDAKQKAYKKFLIKDNLLIGAILAGNIRNSGVYLKLIREKIDISSLKERLLEENFGYPDILGLVKDKEQVYV